MTLSMPDSTEPANLPGGYPAYAGYADGAYRTEAELRARFPSAELVIFTVTGVATAHGMKIVPGADTEPGNLGATGAALWAKRALMADPGSRPVVYADLASEGYSMAEVIAELLKLGITRSEYRVLTAHYTGHAHICSPRECQVGGQPIGFTADGTQWSSSFPGLNGSVIDMSLLADDFFGPLPVSTEVQEILMQLAIVRPGTTGQPVRTVQGLCCARGHAVTIDGVFGPATAAAVQAVQRSAGVAVDGIVGPVTWAKLLGL